MVGRINLFIGTDVMSFFKAVLKTVIGVGSIEDVKVTPLTIIVFAAGVMLVFLGTIASLLLLASIII